MLVDSGVFDGPSTIVADNVESLPETTDPNSLVYLLPGADVSLPGLYLYLNEQWVFLSGGDEVA